MTQPLNRSSGLAGGTHGPGRRRADLVASAPSGRTRAVPRWRPDSHPPACGANRLRDWLPAARSDTGRV